jgi:mono/diheme cytochrome c family protein
VRVATAVAGALAVAAVVMAVLAFTAGGDDEEQGAAPPTATPAAPPTGGDTDGGLAVWAAQGCGSCHTLAAANAHGVIGPDLASSLKGMPASYIKESIVAPNKAAPAGYSTGLMPEDYGARIAPADLDRLVSYLKANARR